MRQNRTAKNSFGAKSILRQKASKLTSLHKEFLLVRLLCVAQNSEPKVRFDQLIIYSLLSNLIFALNLLYLFTTTDAP
jgi:hypothetical protein